MNRLLSVLSIGILVAAGNLTASGQISREVGKDAGSIQLKETPRGIKLSPDMLKMRHQSAESTSGNAIGEVSFLKQTPRARNGSRVSKPGVKAALRATSLQGYCVYAGNAGEPGWYDIALQSGSSLKWKKQGKYSPACGFVRGDEVYSFYTYTTSDAGLTDAGIDIIDLSTGKVKASYPTDIFDTLEKVVLLSAYDSEEDTAYVVTLDQTGKNYLLQKFDPISRSFVNLGVNVPADWLDIGWNPADKTLYLFDTGGLLKKYDSKGKRFSQVNSLSWDMEEYPHDMVYSPKDEAFILLLDSYDESDYPCTDMLLLPVSGNAAYLGTIEGNPQYKILHVSDNYVNAAGAKAPVLKSWDVTGSSTTGSFTVTLPDSYENGTSITGSVYLQAKIDDNDISGAFNGPPGASVVIPVNAPEGLHRFYVTPYTLGDDGKIYGTPLVFDKCIGIDVPTAPAGVTLAETKVSWNAVTKGVNGGYVNVADIKYNVYVDKILMNESPVSSTSLDITIPVTGVVAHKAEVYALSGGKISEAGVSERYYADGPLSLPVYLGAEEGERDLDDEVIGMFTIVKDALNQNEPLRGWRYDDLNENTGGFYCLSPKASSMGETSNEWLFLPAINFTDKDAHYRLSMEVWSGNHYFTANEIYEVALCQRPSPSRAITIKDASTVYKSPYFEQSETLFQVPEEGEWYIGIHYISPVGSYRLYARNFKIEKAEASSESPAAVADLRSKAFPDGELKATLTFNMPRLTISGSELPASTVITATAISEAGEATVTGTPGDPVSMTVPTKQGDNIIKVTTSSDKGVGLLSETTVYCGVYRPATPVVTATVSDDNLSITLDIDLEDYNENGEYTGPAQQDVTIYRQIGGEWRPAAEIGKNRTWTFDCPDGSQSLYTFGVAAKNAVGSCEEMFSFPVHLGPLHSLPMTEPFNCVGDDVKLAYEPISIEHLSYLKSTWGVDDPVSYDEAAANTSGNAIIAMWDGESQLLLPRFTTKGMSNVKLDLSIFFGNHSPERVTVYASSPSLEMEPVATFMPESGNGWEHKLVSLPSAFQNQGWVQIIIRVKIVGYSQCFIMDSYSIANYPSDMVTIHGMNGASRGAVGEKMSYSVEVENAGTKEAAVPDYVFRVIGDNGVIGDFKDADAPKTIEAGKRATLNFSFTPKVADIGDVLVRFNLHGQPSEATSEMEKQVKILNARIPVVQDLALEYRENSSDVLLNWSKPQFVEDFETAETWDYSEELKGFRNIDLDNAKVWTISEVDFPGEGYEKAYQVFSSTVTDNMSMAAHSGEQFLLCMSPKTGVTNDWLISPEVKGGTELSFWMNICHADYPETILVKYSTEGNEPEDFTKSLDNGYICPDEQGWFKYDFQLPADAKYFALHHVGDDGNEQFGLMIDDISYDPVSGVAPIEGYNLYRDEQLIGSGLKETTYFDKGVDTSVPVRYLVKTLSTINGELVESDRSNVVWATGTSGIGDIASDGFVTISGEKGFVRMCGFASGVPYVISNVAGAMVSAGNICDDVENVEVPSGIYIVKCGSFVMKVIVK